MTKQRAIMNQREAFDAVYGVVYRRQGQLSIYHQDHATMVATAQSTKNELINLTSLKNGASILFATDEWFATAENLLNDEPPTFQPDLFCEQGKVMDGWETRRRRSAGHDWCVIKLDSGSICRNNTHFFDRAYHISYIELDTAYFTGNQAPKVSIEAIRVLRLLDCDDNSPNDEDYLYHWMPGASTRLARGAGGKGVRGTGQSPSAVERAMLACQSVARRLKTNHDHDDVHNPNGEWMTVLPITPLKPGYETSRYHTFEISDEVKERIVDLGGVTHLKLNYYPDGGVARIKVFGQPYFHPDIEQPSKAPSTSRNVAISVADPTIHPHSSPDPPPSARNPYPYIELSSELNGGIGLACSNKHYGVPSNLLRTGLGKDMGDGWETARHPNRPSIVVQDPMTRLQDTHLKDWCVVKLGLGGANLIKGIDRIIVDTRHFKGNFPESVTIDGYCAYSDNRSMVSDDDVCKSAGTLDDKTNIESTPSNNWFPLLKRTHLTADAEHEYLLERGHIVNGRRGVTHIRISITPDGGLSRVRIYGAPTKDPMTGGNHTRSHL